MGGLFADLKIRAANGYEHKSWTGSGLTPRRLAGFCHQKVTLARGHVGHVRPMLLCHPARFVTSESKTQTRIRLLHSWLGKRGSNRSLQVKRIGIDDQVPAAGVGLRLGGEPAQILLLLVGHVTLGAQFVAQLLVGKLHGVMPAGEGA